MQSSGTMAIITMRATMRCTTKQLNPVITDTALATTKQAYPLYQQIGLAGIITSPYEDVLVPITSLVHAQSGACSTATRQAHCQHYDAHYLPP